MFRPVAALAVLLGWALAAPASADYITGVQFWGRGDFAGAAREFLPAAQAGDRESQYMMGRLYTLGDGVPQDFAQAWVWFDRAARQGHDLAAEARVDMEQVLTPGQLALARASEQPVLAQTAPPAIVPQPQQLQPLQPVEGRAVVLVPRQGVVASVPPARPSVRPPARLTAPGATAEGSLLASGDLPGQVREVQRVLMREGYYSGPADGALTPATRQAIRDYQRGIGLPQTGLLSSRMVEQLAQDEQILAGQNLAGRIGADQQQAAR